MKHKLSFPIDSKWSINTIGNSLIIKIDSETIHMSKWINDIPEFSSKPLSKLKKLTEEAERRGLTEGTYFRSLIGDGIRKVKYPLYSSMFDPYDNLLTEDNNYLCKSNVWAEPLKILKIEELVKGEIYVDIEGGVSPRIIRVKTIGIESIDPYSQLLSSGGFYKDTFRYKANKLIKANTEEKQKLIKAEIEHRFFYELNK